METFQTRSEPEFQIFPAIPIPHWKNIYKQAKRSFRVFRKTGFFEKSGFFTIHRSRAGKTLDAFLSRRFNAIKLRLPSLEGGAGGG